MRVRTMLPSRWLILSCLLSCFLLVSYGVLPSNAQGATNTPGGGTPTPGYIDLALTATALAGSSPRIHTATPVPTASRDGCVESGFDQDNLDPSWISQCLRCLETRATPVATIQQFTLVTVPPLGTPDGISSVPTLPPLYVPPTVAVPTSPATLTPTVTPINDPTLLAYDFNWAIGSPTNTTGWSAVTDLDWLHDLSADDRVTSSTFTYSTGGIYGLGYEQAPYVPVAGNFSFVLPDGYSLTDVIIAGSGALSIAVMHGGSYSVYGGTNTSEWHGEDYEATAIRVFAYAHANPSISRVRIYFGYDTPPTPSGSETPTATATPMGGVTVISCDEPIYTDVSTPIVNIDFDGTDLGEDCFTIVPELNITATDPDIVYEGLQICVQWHAPPALTILGLNFPVDLILVIPIAFVVRKLMLT